MKKNLLLIIGAVSIIALIFFRKEIYNMANMSGDKWNNLLPAMKTKIKELLARGKEQGLNLMFFDGWRSAESERAHMASGASKLKDPFNTHHLWGYAADIVFVGEFGEPSWLTDDDPRWEKMRALARSVGLLTPIAWDKPHIELPGYTLADIRRKYDQDYQAFLESEGVNV